ncbi:hypothetical protein FIBSPDRAFT_181820 [Athelia psychrophila]|uniref:Uncharacterized protein n=1 Tax=Athelia psychrophila TaxID=1759441 RepID=A0A166AKP4_9AGAM|nr:hypothetical protein FIBSPDRAFT_181820 [Fibularhizoctonia sp. CBS 109695]
MDAKRKIEDLVDEKLDIKKAKIEDEIHCPTSVSALPPLRRALVPPVTHDTPQGFFTCHGTGLLKNAVPFMHDISHCFAVTTDAYTKTGRPVTRRTVPTKQTTVWWKAQCVFRGLSDAGSAAVLQARLEPAQNAGMTDELRAVETRLNAEFRAKNAEAHETLWKSLNFDQAKAAEHPARFLEEKYLPRKLACDAVLLDRHGVSYQEMNDAAEKLGLACEMAGQWTVVGPVEAVSAKVKEIHDMAKRAAVLANPRRLEVERTLEQAIDDKEARIAERHAQVVMGANADPDAEWDVSGTWAIDCPHFTSQWRDVSGSELDCQLVIAVDPGSGSRQMWACFQFLIYAGVFRFSKLGDVSAVKGTHNEPSRRGVTRASAGTISTSSNDRPSSGTRTWKYEWHGEYGFSGCSGGEFEEQHGYITFDEPKGTTLAGEFSAVASGEEFSFTGRKVSADIEDITGILNKSVSETEDDITASTANITAQDIAREWANSDRHVQNMSSGHDLSD